MTVSIGHVSSNSILKNRLLGKLTWVYLGHWKIEIDTWGDYFLGTADHKKICV